MIGYIYKTTNLLNGKIYLGKHVSDEFDPSYKGSGRLLWQAINKYGWDNFSVEMLCPCFSIDELNSEEKFLIKYFSSRDREVGYNIAKGGDGGDTYSALSPEAKSNCSAKLRTYCITHNTVSRMQSPEVRRKHSESMLGFRHSKSSRLKISKATSGKNNPFYGKHHSADTRKHLSECQRGTNSKMYGIPRPEEVRAKIARGCIGRQFHLVCRSCHKEFIGNSGAIKLCPECKKSGGM